MNDDILIDTTKTTIIKREDLEKTETVHMSIKFEEDNDVAGLLNGFKPVKEEYDWHELDLGEEKGRIFLLNPNRLTKEEVIAANPGLHPSRLFYVKHEELMKSLQESFTKGSQIKGEQLRMSMTFRPSGTIEVSE
jgi:hypothetical protein